jgi:hypothetical protein
MWSDHNRRLAGLILLGILVIAGVRTLAKAQDDVDTQFATMAASFSKIATASFGESALSTSKVPSVYVSKRFLARSIATAVTKASITVTIHVPGRRFTAPFSKVTTQSIEPIPCSDRGCNSNCDPWDLGCWAAKYDCERLKVQEKLACELKKSAQQSISDKLILTAYLYDIDTGASDTVWIAADGSASVSAMTVTDDLKQASLTAVIKASALVSTKLKFVFEPVLKAFLILWTRNPSCILDEEFFVKDQPVGFDEAAFRLPISLSEPYVKDDKVVLDIHFDKTSVMLRFNRSPIAKMIASDWRNLRNVVACPAIPVAAVTVEELFPNDIMKKDQELPAMSATQTIASLAPPVFVGRTYSLTLLTTETAVGVRADVKAP